MPLAMSGEPSEAHLLKLVEQLCGVEAAQHSALSELHSLSISRDVASLLRLGGIAKPLVKVMGTSKSQEARTQASELASALATHDVPSAELLVREGLVKVVCSELGGAGKKELLMR
jgi:hypothetical protein